MKLHWHLCFVLFKLHYQISSFCLLQLSSKSDNRLFRVCFRTMHAQTYPFLEAYSHPIRCISRNRSNRPLALGKRLASTAVLFDEIHSLKVNDGSGVIQDIHGDDCFHILNQNVLRCNTPSKHAKLENDKSPSAIDTSGILEKVHNACN